MEENISEWLTNDFLKTCLESDTNGDTPIIIISHRVEPAVPPGNNYGSRLFRVKIVYKILDGKYKEHTISLIVKAPLFFDHTEEKPLNEYKKEIMFYNKYMEETYKIYKHDLVPKHFASPNPNVLVLEDLKTSGYVMGDRHKLLDYSQCQAYIKASAKLHALSIAVNKRNPELIKSLVEESQQNIDNNKTLEITMMKLALRCMAAYLEDKPKYKEFRELFKKASDCDILQSHIEKMEMITKPFQVLIQRDPWCNNMMFKYNSSGEVVGVKIIDFQNLKFTSPVEEFLVFLWTNPQPNIRKVHLNEFYLLYCDSLNASLEKLGFAERLSHADFLQEMNLMNNSWAFIVVSLMGPICLADEPVDFNEFSSNDIFKIPTKETSFYKLFQGTTFNKFYPQVLDEIDDLGIFDYMKQLVE